MYTLFIAKFPGLINPDRYYIWQTFKFNSMQFVSVVLPYFLFFWRDMYSRDRLRLFPVTVWCFLRKASSRAYFQYTGVSSMVWGAASVLQDLCEDLVLKNTAAWEISSNNLAPPKRIVSKICPRLCSERGRCINGTCKCRRGISLFFGIIGIVGILII